MGTGNTNRRVGVVPRPPARGRRSDPLDRDFLIRPHADRIDPPRSPGLAAGLSTDLQHRQWYLIRADDPISAYNHARNLVNFVTEIGPPVTDALRSAGLLHLAGEEPRLALGQLWRLKQAIADAMAEVVTPQSDLAAVSDGLWQIERIIRKFLRDAAVADSPKKWRNQLLNATLAETVLGRARGDVNVTAVSVAELRDPIEWLTLGELLDLVQSKKFGGLFWDELTWRLFKNDIVPIRNRLSHMRLLKRSDKATVRMWVKRVTDSKAPPNNASPHL